MTTLISTAEAADRLGVRPATLYAYVSRGRVQRTRGVDGRRSFFAADEIDELVRHTRRRDVISGSLIPVRIDTAITELGESMFRMRGHDAVALADVASFEQVAELLWTGEFRSDVDDWTVPPVVDADARRVAEAVGGTIFTRLSAAMLATGRIVDGNDALVAARVILSIAPSALGAPSSGSMASRVSRIWFTEPDPRLTDVVRRVLVLLADHELASCTLAARVAASTRTELAGCLVAGVSTLSGPLHGGAARAVHLMMIDAEQIGGHELITRYRQQRQPVPGFGHRVYKSGDPRVIPILDPARALSRNAARTATVDTVLQAAAQLLPVAANVDLALGAFSYLADLPLDAASVMFSIARLAGIVAHVLDEYDAAPLRYRTTTRFIPRIYEREV